MTERKSISRQKLIIEGVVQGVGFRPFVYRLAERHGIAGWVRNTSGGVEIDAEGAPASLDAFVCELRTGAPALARIDSLSTIKAEPVGFDRFEILESEHGSSTRAMIPADVSTCSDCLHEIADPDARRYRYPFTNCTNCGPRFTIIEHVPYGRSNTTMAAFEMCSDCAAEYANPEDRRFHAEPIACPVCGPRVWLEANGANTDSDVLAAAGKLLCDGKVVAIKGLGGFHLACDARNDRAVLALRDRKGRTAKPFALMVCDVDEAECLCEIDEFEKSLLCSYERPIVLLKRHANGEVSESVAPSNKYLGIMLPYTPLHALLFEHSPPALVMTSGNLSEEPLVFQNDDARSRLLPLADAFLMHDRDIHVPCDDSVIRLVEDGIVIPIRRARGFVPNAVELPLDAPNTLGCGAEQKSTFCLAWDRTAIISQHVGDLDTVETFDYYQYAIEHFKSLCEREPSIVAHDLHPSYLSTQYARGLSGVKLVAVQHHHAHIASCLAEYGRVEKCIGIALDGTGYGTDGTVWGGEILVADLADFTRAGHFAQVRLPGGEAAIRDPRRMAAAYMHAAFGSKSELIAARLGLIFTSLETRILRRQLETGLNSPITSSAGRLFDAVSAAIGVCRERTYEGQPAIELEMIADEREDGSHETRTAMDGDVLILDGVSLFRDAVEDAIEGVEMPVISAKFHNSVVNMVVSACRAVRDRTGLNVVALSGGVFQNALIVTRLQRRLKELGFEVLIHNRVPPNDACISLGQVAIAAAWFARENRE